MRQIAIYGKGGIGKSTISANISANLSEFGRRVLQIGCDPKHDSTSLLMRGERIVTVLDYLKEMRQDKWNLNDIMQYGFNNVACVEAGGPEPGVGCAGRGILTTFDVLKKLDINSQGFDTVLYDVLGDVVCGGFAVPVRTEYADTIYIVTSGEYMSIYAANNILRGVKNYDNDKFRIGGLIFNRRGISEEEERVNKFAKAVGLPVSIDIPRSDEFAIAEKKGVTLSEEYPDSEIKKKFSKLANEIISDKKKYPANPLTDELLEEVVLGAKITKKQENIVDEETSVVNSDYPDDLYVSKNVLNKEPLHGCAFNGSVIITTQIKDAVTIAHGPKSCAHISYNTLTSAGRRTFQKKGVVRETLLNPSLTSSDMNESVMIYGGMDVLNSKISEVLKDSPAAIFVPTTCPSGIIGDNVESVRSLSNQVTPVIPLMTDGNINGDFYQGLIDSYIEVARSLVDKNVRSTDCSINIFAEKHISNNNESNFAAVETLLNKLDVAVNCRYICDTTVDRVVNIKRAGLNMLAYNDHPGMVVRNFFEKEYSMKFMESAYPIGFSQTVNWLEEVASYFGKQEKVFPIVEEMQFVYDGKIKFLKPLLKGKRIFILTYNHNIDWLIKPLIDLEMNIVKIASINSSHCTSLESEYSDQLEIEREYEMSKRDEDISMHKPDIVLGNYVRAEESKSYISDNIPMCPDVGFFSGLELVERWTSVFKVELKESWKNDEKLFKKYFGR